MSLHYITKIYFAIKSLTPEFLPSFPITTCIGEYLHPAILSI